MSNFKMTSKVKMIILMLAIGFVTYNVVLFAICGFTNHGAAFWLSYVFMLIAFSTLSVSGYLLKNRGMQPKDWLLGYPVLRHCTIYIILELIASIIFMVLDYKNCPWAVAFSIQMILLAVHLVFIISCFLAKDIIEDVQYRVKEDTTFAKLLKIDAEMIAEKSDNPDVKNAFLKLSEQIRYSDPMRNPALEQIENQIAHLISDADVCVSMNDNEAALSNCRKAMLLLKERNKKCQALK